MLGGLFLINDNRENYFYNPMFYNPMNNPSTDSSPDIVTVRPARETLTRQQLPYFVGISEQTAGTTGISMNLVVIPPGAAAKPHFHKDFETAIFILKGRVETRYGKGLKQSVINETGDFLFIPPGMPHQPRNLSTTEAAQAIVARNDPNEQENVVMYDPDLDP
jgi:uncharacterized RmlC-like cupin family protein